MQEGWGLRWGLTRLVRGGRHRGEESAGGHSPPPHPPSSGLGGDRGREGVQGPPPYPHATGRADAQSRQKTYSV